MRSNWFQFLYEHDQRIVPAAARCVRLWFVCLTCTVLLAGCSSQRFARKHARETAEQLASQARAAADRGDSASAEYFLTAAVNTNPRDCEARLELSEMLLEHGSVAAATEHLRQLVEQHPDDSRGHVRLARVLYLQQDGAAAGELIDKALEIDPDNPQAWLVRARLERDHKSDYRALAACYRVLAVDPDQAEARLLAADIHLDHGNPQQASPLLRALLENPSECPIQRAEASWQLGRCYALEGRWNDAAATLSAAVRERDGTAADWYQVGYANYRAGDLDTARSAVTAALRIAPSNAEALSLSRLLEARAVRTAGAIDDGSPVVHATSQASTASVAPSATIMSTP
ncbi:MAG TPA: tetratricopeptide repeat protein [Planctomycetaceae bacterium]|nr:tetratricopeptide repeat protein [Planctomycetaceae bacterium]